MNLIELSLVFAVLAILCLIARGKLRKVRWLFIPLTWIFWIAFFITIGYYLGFYAGTHGVTILHHHLG